MDEKSLSSETFKAFFNMDSIEKTKLLNRYDKKKYSRKKRKLKEKFKYWRESFRFLLKELKINLLLGSFTSNLYITILI